MLYHLLSHNANSLLNIYELSVHPFHRSMDSVLLMLLLPTVASYPKTFKIIIQKKSKNFTAETSATVAAQQGVPLEAAALHLE